VSKNRPILPELVGNPTMKNEKVSEDYGKSKLTAVAAFLPWRGSSVAHP